MTNALSLPLPEIADQFLLRKDVAFLNHGSFGACPRPVFDVYQNWQRELECEPVDFLGRRTRDLLGDARARLADFVGAQADDLVFVPNATYGMNIVAHSLALQPGDEVLTTDHEYGAINKTWRFVCERQGAKYINQPISVPVADPEEMVAQLWAGVSARTKVISVSHITSPTALRFPVERICRRARAEGLLTVIDGAHAPGQVDLDMAAIGADFYTGNCHKWLMGAKGSAFLYARPECQKLLSPLVVSHGWANERSDNSPFQDYFTWVGTIDPAAYLTVPAAIDFQQEHDWSAVREACHQLGLETRRRIQERTGLVPIAPEDQQWWAQMFVASLPPRARGSGYEQLWEKYRVEVPIFEWNGHHFARISIQAYTQPEHVDRLIQGLGEIFGWD